MPNTRKGHPPRLSGWDYSADGAYFVTFTVHDRNPVLGSIDAGQVRLSSLGQIVQQCWMHLPRKFMGVQLDKMVVMPDHVHAIVVLCGALIHQGPEAKALMNQDPEARALMNQDPEARALIHQDPQAGALIHQDPEARALMNQGPTKTDQGPSGKTGTLMPMMTDPRLLLGKVIRAWKAESTHLIRRAGQSRFSWQTRYYEHVIRSERALHRIRQYIASNPARAEGARGRTA